jgi:hypothetical protein
VAEAVHVEGLKEFRAGLKEAGVGWPRQLTKTNQELARWLAPMATSAAQSVGGATKHFASSIRGMGTQASARLEVEQRANAAFWGAKKRTGWNRGNATPNQPAWVGNSWDPGGSGGPYAINATIAANLDAIEERYGVAIEELTHLAFPS